MYKVISGTFGSEGPECVLSQLLETVNSENGNILEIKVQNPVINAYDVNNGLVDFRCSPDNAYGIMGHVTICYKV